MLLTITTTGKVVLLLVALSFIAFALVTSMVIPKRRPGFPGDRLPTYITVAVLFFAAQMAAVWWVTGTQEVEGEREAVATETEPAETEPAETESAETTPAETTPAETTPAETEPAETEPAETEPAGEGDPAAGKEVFASQACGGCHTLADAGASGSVGPNLDETKPSYDLVVDRVTNGKGGMPSFSGSLDEGQIADVSAYVSSVAGQ